MKSGKKQKPSRKRIVAKQLADDLDVSISTISRAFKRDSVISAKTRSMVLEYADAVGYRPNPFAQSLITRKSKIVGIVVSDIENPFYPEALTGLCEALRQAGLNAMLFSVPFGQTPDEILPQAMVYHPEFVIVMATTISSRAVEEAARYGTNLIFFNRYVPGTASFSITCDNVLGGREIADHLIDNGHRRMAYIAGSPDASTTMDRWRGYSQQCAAKGFSDVRRAEANAFSYDAGFEAALTLMEESPGPDAIFCANDMLALGALDALRGRLGLEIPDDVSIAGFDNISLTAWPSHSLTTYHQPIEEMIARTLSLIDRIGADPEVDTEAVRIEGRIVIRESTRTLAREKRKELLDGRGHGAVSSDAVQD